MTRRCGPALVGTYKGRARRRLGAEELAKADGRSFFVIPGSSGRLYWTDQVSCTCLDVAHRGATCKHQLAVQLWNLRQKGAGDCPTRLPRRQLDPARVAALSAEYSALFPADE